mgnify:CR=1 FL=1
MIVIRILEDNSGDEVEQEIYCGDPCYPDFKGYLSKFNIYKCNHRDATCQVKNAQVAKIITRLYLQ